MSIIVPLHKWRSADPAILIGRRCIARTDDDVVIDGRLELIRRPDCTATLTDTRQVDCIVYSTNGKQAGLSCDWSHVSVAGKEPAR